MTPEIRERFAVLVERRLAGLLNKSETYELSRLLETSGEARELYLSAVEFHLDLGTAVGSDVAAGPAPALRVREENNLMARIALNCSCSWNFFIPGTTTGYETFCPSCGQAVRIPGRKPGRDVPRSAGEVAAEKQLRQWLTRVAVLSVAAGFLIVATLFGYWIAQKPPTGDVSVSVSPRDTLPGVVPGQPARSRPPIQPLPEPPPSLRLPAMDYNNGPQIDELKRAVYSNVWLTNMTCLISECMRFRNLTNEWGQLQADMGVYDGKIKHNLKELAKVGEKVALENYLTPGDQILGFAQRDFTTMKPGEASAFIQEWVTKWRAGPSLEQLNFVRNDRKMTIYLEFPEETKELLSLVRHPALGLAGDPGSGPITELVAVPADLIKDIDARFDALPAGYRSFLVAKDRTRFEDMMRTRKGTSDDLEWLKSRILGEAIPSFQRDADIIRSKALAIEPKLKENVASDVIYRKNGTKIEGQIIQQTDTVVKIKCQFGTVSIPAEDIQRVEKGKGAALDFPAKYADASRAATPAERVEKLAPLLAWCIEKSLKLHKEYVAFVILSLDPSHDAARKAAGMPRPAISAPSLLPSTPK
jgi:hypothetical protein